MIVGDDGKVYETDLHWDQQQPLAEQPEGLEKVSYTNEDFNEDDPFREMIKENLTKVLDNFTEKHIKSPEIEVKLPVERSPLTATGNIPLTLSGGVPGTRIVDLW